MFVEDSNWMDVEGYLARDDRAVLVTGACEQHAYLSLMSDIRIPVEIARAACAQEDVLVFPALPFGISPYFTSFPGTVSLRPETFALLLRETIDNLLTQGFRRILVSNGHGGNSGVIQAVLIEIANAHPEASLALYQWWLHPHFVAAAAQHGLPQYHANWEENFRFTRVAQSPARDKPPVAFSRTANAAATRAALGDGSYGGPYQVSDEIMDQVFDVAVKAMVAALRAL